MQLDRLFAGRLADTAIYRAGGSGAGVNVKAIPVEMDGEVTLNGRSVAVPQQVLAVRKSEVASPSGSDTIEWAGDVWKIRPAPLAKHSGLVWHLECTR